MASPEHMQARLIGPRQIRVAPGDPPGEPGPGEARLRITSVGICGSDLHAWRDGRSAGRTLSPEQPLVLGHEFAGLVDAVGADALDGTGRPLTPGTLVAVDPAQPCGRCEMCRLGHPNLCLHLHFCGLWPDHGALQTRLTVPAATCFPLPADIDAAGGALLETLGVAIHAVDLAHIRPGQSVAVLGAGPVGLLALQMAKLAGAAPLIVTEPLAARAAMARQLGADVVIETGKPDAVAAILNATQQRGVDVAIEAAFSGQTVIQAADMLRPGGRLVVVGISEDNRFELEHETARRKGLTIAFSRRMKHTYPRAIDLVQRGRVALDPLITHRYPLARTDEAFDLTGRYADGVIKAIIDVNQ